MQYKAGDTITLPLMTLREVVLFPRTVVPLYVGRDSSIKAIERACEQYGNFLFLITQRDATTNSITRESLYPVGTLAKVLQTLKMPDGTLKVLFEGLQRAHMEELISKQEEYSALMRIMSDGVLLTKDENVTALLYLVRDALKEYIEQSHNTIQESQCTRLLTIEDPGHLADAIMPLLRAEFTKKQAVLELIDPMERLHAVYELLTYEVTMVSLEKKIKRRVKNQMEQNQREYYLSEQLKAIQKEMGKDENAVSEIDELAKRIREKKMSEEAEQKLEKEVSKLRSMTPASSEYTVVKTYIDTVLELPWNAIKPIDVELARARDILASQHYGLEKAKERMLEFLAVQSLKKEVHGPILCLVGPPGVGKTSFARSVAEATGREFIRIALGGVRDEAEIRGHRRTYVGALPGKIIQAIKRVHYNNPLICLDEIDKMSSDMRGDPASALLEVLDPEQNTNFRDHYLDLDYDLSKIFFITTANNVYDIPYALRDRMEVIPLSGYLEEEKKHIVRDFMLKKQIEAHGLQESNIRISDNVIKTIIRSYTKEAGVRNLERAISTLCRKVAKELVDAGDFNKTVSITKHRLQAYLGPVKHRSGDKEPYPQVGVCTGLAYTELGGELLLVETLLMHGTGQVHITGKLGEVMMESARAALSYVRSRSDYFNLRDDFHKEVDIHIHVPEGATPKDGPSAGITLASSLLSALLGLPIRNDIAMTGEISLRGRVLPIGGLKEKLYAAQRGGITTVFIPKDNEKDLYDVPTEVKNGMQIIGVNHIDELLPYVFVFEKDVTWDSIVHSATPIYTLLHKVQEKEKTKRTVHQ